MSKWNLRLPDLFGLYCKLWSASPRLSSRPFPLSPELEAVEPLATLGFFLKSANFKSEKNGLCPLILTENMLDHDVSILSRFHAKYQQFFIAKRSSCMQKQLVEKERILAQIPLGFNFLMPPQRFVKIFATTEHYRCWWNLFFVKTAIEANFDFSYENFMSFFVK